MEKELHIVLTTEKLQKVLTEPCPDAPLEDAPEEVVRAYDAWKAADDLAKCYILASMENVLQQQHVSMETAADMMTNLADMFAN